MAFTSLTELKRTTGNCVGRGPGYRRAHDTALVSVIQAGGKGSKRHALSITLYPAVLKKARLVKGDRVDILFDKEDGLCLIRRNNAGAWCFSGQGASKRGSQTLRLQVTLVPGMPYFAYQEKMTSQAADWDIDESDGSLLLQLPRHPVANGGPVGW